MSDRVVFDVEAAGCESCGKLLRTALSTIATVEKVEIDEAADKATVTLGGDVSRRAVETTLEQASGPAGHAYRISPGSWVSLAPRAHA